MEYENPRGFFPFSFCATFSLMNVIVSVDIDQGIQ